MSTTMMENDKLAEKVLIGIDAHLTSNSMCYSDRDIKCPYYENGCFTELLGDARQLIDELQQTVEAYHDDLKETLEAMEYYYKKLEDNGIDPCID